MSTHGDVVDVATGYLEKELSISLSNTDKEILELIDQALERIDSKTYGICIDTGEVIGKSRLKAMPEAAHALTAQEKMDRKNRKRHWRFSSLMQLNNLQQFQNFSALRFSIYRLITASPYSRETRKPRHFPWITLIFPKSRTLLRLLLKKETNLLCTQCNRRISISKPVCPGRA